MRLTVFAADKGDCVLIRSDGGHHLLVDGVCSSTEDLRGKDPLDSHETCDIADPYQVITWTPPEGGEGPDYTQM